MDAWRSFIRLVMAAKSETLSIFAQLILIGVRGEGRMVETKTACPIQAQRKGNALPRLAFPSPHVLLSYDYLGINFIFNSCCNTSQLLMWDSKCGWGAPEEEGSSVLLLPQGSISSTYIIPDTCCLFLPQWTDIDGDFESLQATSLNISLSWHTWKGVVLSPLLLLVA